MSFVAILLACSPWVFSPWIFCSVSLGQCTRADVGLCLWAPAPPQPWAELCCSFGCWDAQRWFSQVFMLSSLFSLPCHISLSLLPSLLPSPWQLTPDTRKSSESCQLGLGGPCSEMNKCLLWGPHHPFLPLPTPSTYLHLLGTRRLTLVPKLFGTQQELEGATAAVWSTRRTHVR